MLASCSTGYYSTNRDYRYDQLTRYERSEYRYYQDGTAVPYRLRVGNSYNDCYYPVLSRRGGRNTQPTTQHQQARPQTQSSRRTSSTVQSNPTVKRTRSKSKQ